MNRNRNFKSSVFSLMMQDKVKALNVYNVLGNSHFDNPEDVEIITTDGGISLSVRNDASFIIGTDMNFYEHQSTYNPNMPMRSLIYCTDAIDRRIKEKNENLYGHKQIKIPTPPVCGILQRAGKAPGSGENVSFFGIYGRKEKSGFGAFLYGV